MNATRVRPRSADTADFAHARISEDADPAPRQGQEKVQDPYEQLFVGNPAPMFIFAPESLALVATNPAFQQLYGYPEAETLTLTLADLHPDSQRDSAMQFAAAPIIGAAAGVWRQRRKDGALFHVTARSSAIQFEGKTCTLCVVTDLSGVDQIDHELVRDQSILQQMFSTSHVGIGLLDLHGRFLLGNDYAANMLGVAPGAIAGTEYFSYVPAEKRKSASAAMRHLLARKIPAIDVERQYLRPDGSRLWGHLVARLCCDAQGKLLGVLGVMNDITARKQVDTALQHQNQMLERTGRLARVGGWSLDAKSMQVTLSGEAALLHDVQTGITVPLADWLASFPAFDGKALDEALAGTIRQARPCDLELELVSPAGAHKWVRMMGFPIMEGDRVAGIEGAIQDITDLRRARDQVRQSDVVLHSVFQAIPDLFFLMDADSTIRDYRARNASDLYVPPSTFLGKRMVDVVPPAIGARFADSLRAALGRDGLVSFEYDLALGETEHRFEARLSRLAGGKRCIAIVRDVTERHLATAALTKSEARYRDLLERAPFPLVVSRMRDGMLQYGNQRARILLGLPDRLNQGLPASGFYRNSALREEMVAQLRREKCVFDQEMQMLGADGRPFWALISASTIEFENEPAILAAINEITARKNAEIALEQERAQLRERVKEQRCLYEVFALTEDIQSPLAAQLEQVAARIAGGWQFPDIAAARIEWAGATFSTPGFAETPWMQIASTAVHSAGTVRLTVGYREERPTSDEGPFLNEERALAEALVRRLADVVNRRHAAQSLREREELVATMFAQTTDAIAIVDPDSGRFVDFNAAAHAGLGYTRHEFGLLAVADVDHGGQPIAPREHTATASTDFETRHRHRDGRLLDAAVSIRPVVLGGRPLCCAVWRDVTAQKAREREQAALTGRARLHSQLIGQISAAESAIDGDVPGFARELTATLGQSLGIERVSVWLMDPTGTRLTCVDLYELTSGNHSQGMVLEEDAFRNEFQALVNARYVDASEPFADPRTAGYVEPYLKPTGITSMLDCSIISSGRTLGTVCFEHVARPHQWQPDEIAFGCQVADQVGMAILLRDRLAASRALAQSETALRRAQSVSLTGHWYMDIRRGSLDWSAETYRMFGLAHDAKVGPDALIDCVHPDDRERVMAAWSHALDGEPYDITHRILRHGETRWVRQRAEIERDAHGRPASALGIVQDVTLSKQSEERIHRLNRVFAVLSGTNEAIVRVRNGDALFAEVCRIAVEAGSFAAAWIGALDQDGKLRLVARAGESSAALQDIPHPVAGEDIIGRALRTATPAISNDVASDPATLSWCHATLGRSYGSAAAFPVSASGRVVAVFNLYAVAADSFDDEEIELFERLAHNLGFAL
ncbi:MAG: PAS domain S-box protein, partial [Rhodocyclaceae bacterium]